MAVTLTFGLTPIAMAAEEEVMVLTPTSPVEVSHQGEDRNNNPVKLTLKLKVVANPDGRGAHVDLRGSIQYADKTTEAGRVDLGPYTGPWKVVSTADGSSYTIINSDGEILDPGDFSQMSASATSNTIGGADDIRIQVGPCGIDCHDGGDRCIRCVVYCYAPGGQGFTLWFQCFFCWDPISWECSGPSV